MGVASALILLWTHGQVAVLVVLYSINVFLTFSLSLLGLCIYWWRHKQEPRWIARFGLSLLGLTVTASILAVTVIEKFTSGGWLTLLVTGIAIALCVLVKRHYMATRAELANADATFRAVLLRLIQREFSRLTLPTTAIVLVGKHPRREHACAALDPTLVPGPLP